MVDPGSRHGGHGPRCEKMGRNTGIKAVFGTVKKPLMTKVSMRHLNEIVRERNQYSRDALEAWQDFINLKGRMRQSSPRFPRGTTTWW